MFVSPPLALRSLHVSKPSLLLPFLTNSSPPQSLASFLRISSADRDPLRQRAHSLRPFDSSAPFTSFSSVDAPSLKWGGFGYPLAQFSLALLRPSDVVCAGSLRSPAVARFARHAERGLGTLVASLECFVCCVGVGVHRFFSKSMESGVYG